MLARTIATLALLLTGACMRLGYGTGVGAGYGRGFGYFWILLVVIVLYLLFRSMGSRSGGPPTTRPPL